MTKSNKQISNPFSTGGGGSSFEIKVQSAFVATMLSGGSAPTHPNSSIIAIKLQRRYEKYKVDDFIAECQNLYDGQECKLLAQVKHSISITKGNKEFSEVISAAWSDFNNPEIFSPDSDCIALITGPLSKTDVQHVRPLLDWARHSAKADEFFQKVDTPNFGSGEKHEKLAAFKYHLEQANGGKTPEDEKIWQFLKCFYLIGYDFDATSGGNLSLIQSMLKLSIVETASPNDVWAKLVTTMQDFNPDAGTITFDTLPKEVRDDFKSGILLASNSSIDKLKEHGDLILKGIRTCIAKTHVKRTHYVDLLAEYANKSNFVIITGSRGSGKSAVVKDFAKIHCEADLIFCLRTEDLNRPHLDEVFTSIGIPIHLSELSARFAMMPKKYLIIESLEKLLELDNREAFCDLLEFLKASGEWIVIASCREYALQQICSTYLQYQGVSHSILKVEEFSENEFNQLINNNPKLKTLATNEKLNRLLRNPFMADMAVRVINSDTQSNITDEISFRKAVWQGVIRKESERTDGMPAKRAQAFIEISTQRAKQMVYEISENGFAEDAIYKLEEDGLLYRNSEKGLVRPSHDVLEDWAIEEFIEKAYQANSIDHNTFFKSIGNEPSIMRAFRFWLHQKLNIAQNPDEIRDWCINILEDANIAAYWHDEIIIAILSGQYTTNFLSSLRHKLLENNSKLLKRFCFLMRLACKISNTEAIQNIPDSGIKQYISFMLYKAWGDCWSKMIKFLFENRNEINFKLLPEAPAILEDYSNLININEGFPDATREMGLLALYLLEKVKDDYRSEMQQRLLKIIIKTAPKIKTEFNNMLEHDVFGKTHRDRPSYVEHLVEYILVSLDSVMLCKYYPDLVIRLAWQEWILRDSHPRDPFGSSRIEVEECFGLSHDYDLRGFHPASGLKGPFWALLKWHKSKGLDLIIKLCNHAAEKYAESRLDGQSDYQVDVIFNDGTVHKQFCTGRLWGGYRGITVLPNLLQSALMALENWLIGTAQQQDKKKLPEILDYILKQSNSIMTTAVIASIATGFPEIAGDTILPLLRTAEFYSLDTQRRIQDSSSININWHRGIWSRDVYSVVYAEERDTSNSHKWRKEELEFLVCKLQFTQMRDKVYEIIDNYFKKFTTEGMDTENWRFRLLRTDLRNCKVVEDKENNCFRFVSTTELDPDLKEKSDTVQQEQEEMQGFMNLFLWAEKEFEGESTETQYFHDYKEVLSSIRKNIEILNKTDRKEKLSCWTDGVIKSAAVLIRDHAKELNKSDLSLCIKIMVNSIVDSLNSSNQSLVSSYSKASLAIAQVLPIILDCVEKAKKVHIRELIVNALTHTNRDFNKNIAIGIQKYLWEREPDFAQRCFDGAFEFARLHKVQWDSRRPILDEDTNHEFQHSLHELKKQIIKSISTVNSDDISFDSHINSNLLTPFLMIPGKSISQQHTSLFRRMITLIQNAEVDDQKHNRHRESNLDLEEKFEFAKCLTRHIWVLPANDRDKVVQTITNRIVDDLVLADDLLLFSLVESEQKKSLGVFWNIWEQLATAIQGNIKVILSNRHSEREGKQLINRLLFTDFSLQNNKHKEELREILTYGQNQLLTFVKNTCANVVIYEDFAKLVLYFPDLFFSDGLFVLSSHAKNDANILDGINTIYYLEHLLRKILISIRSSNRIQSHFYDACLLLLNAMVEKGSTIAFFLREHLLTIRYY